MKNLVSGDETSYTAAKVPASPRNLTWFTRLFLLVRGWGLGTRLRCGHETTIDVLSMRLPLQNVSQFMFTKPTSLGTLLVSSYAIQKPDGNLNYNTL